MSDFSKRITLGVMQSAHSAINDGPWWDSLRKWRDAGLQTIDLLDYVDLSRTKGAKLSVSDIAKRLHDLGIGLPVVSVRTDLVSGDAAVRADSLDRIRIALEGCELFGAKILFSYGGQHTNEGPEAFTRFADGLDKACSLAAESGIAFTIENAGKLCGRAEELAKMVKTVGEDRLKVTPDPGNFLIARLDAVAATKLLAGYSVHCHVKDLHEEENGAHPPYEYCKVGAGLTGWAEIMRILDKAGYSGMLEFEPSGKVKPEQTPENLAAIRAML
ncbi:MAG TPA: sugar phosphate isomerase/epimerase family protein [Candidatus Brocadiia bacterium]|nr:sugar phosphate isomerase/epimerase family protein [Candidatus Brocadiia bacterium]